MWFDVLVSVTTQQVPRFLGVETYRQIVNNALISDPLTGGAGGEEIPMSMLPVVGCENKVVLLSAETSNLAHCWKESMLRCGRLSYSDIVQRGLGTEEMYLTRNTPVRLEPDRASPAGHVWPAHVRVSHGRWPRGKQREGGRVSVQVGASVLARARRPRRSSGELVYSGYQGL